MPFIGLQANLRVRSPQSDGFPTAKKLNLNKLQSQFDKISAMLRTFLSRNRFNVKKRRFS